MGALLYQQGGPIVGASLSQNFEAAQDANDSLTADDFVVPAEGWTLDRITASGQVNTGSSLPDDVTINIWFYANDTNLPGDKVCGYEFVRDAEIWDTNLTIVLPHVCVLDAGTYWVSVQVNLDSGVNRWGWNTTTTVANNGAAFQNPGDGLGTGCTTWTDIGTCANLGFSVDTIYALYGSPNVTTDLVDNGGFEATDGARSTRAPVLDPWVVTNGTGDKIKTNTDTKTISHTGAAAFRFKGGVGESSKIQQVIDLTGLAFSKGDIFEGSLFVNASNPAAAGKVKLVVSYSGYIRKSVAPLGATSGYQEILLDSMTAPFSNVTKIKFQIKHFSPAGKLYVDDVVLNWTPAAAANAAQPSLIPLP
jgi:hypothetical protein